MKHLILFASLALFFVTRAQAADNVYLSLKSNGTPIQGESNVTSLGRANTIECFSYQQNVEVSGTKKVYTPLTITKRIDKSSPLLLKSMLGKEMVDANFRFFRPNPSGDGTTEQFYTVTLSGARIVSIKQVVPETRDKANASLPPQEEIAFAFTRISWTYTNGGVTYEDVNVQIDGLPAVPAPLLRIPSILK